MSYTRLHDKDYEASGFGIGIATDSALECLAWSEIDYKTEEPLDSFGLEFTDEARARLFPEVMTFIANNGDDLEGLDYGQIGHDFILTRNHHGAGFWDRGLGKVGDRLTDAAHAYGDIHAFITDNGNALDWE